MSFEWVIRILKNILSKRRELLPSQSGWEKYWNKKRIAELEKAIEILRKEEK